MNTSLHHLISSFNAGDVKALARCISIVENETSGWKEVLTRLTIDSKLPIVGITGPPGAGKSTLLNALVNELSLEGKKIGIVAVDPTSPFTHGALLGDRLRLSENFNKANVFIRSIASRGALGGLSNKIIEISDVMRAFGFDWIFIETVGVGQNEIEIARLADITVLVLVPEAGDEVQTLKSGIMEIGDVFVVNKSDRPGADLFAKNLIALIHSRHTTQASVIKTVASSGLGIKELIEVITTQGTKKLRADNTLHMAEKAFNLIQASRMKDIQLEQLRNDLAAAMQMKGFNLYRFIERY